MSYPKTTPSKPYRWEVLERLAKENHWGRGVELGVYEGKTFLHLLKTRKSLVMYGVDIWEPRPEKDSEEGGCAHLKCGEQMYQELLSKCQAIAPGRFHLIRNTTSLAHHEFDFGSLDFVFIDADHTYEGCKQDIKLWSPIIRDRGMILGHDINFPTVKQAVEESFSRYEVYTNEVWGAKKEWLIK